MKRRAFSYVRFSSPEQAKGDSLRRQLKKATDWCEANNAELDESLSIRDLGVSAYRGKNATKGALAGFLDAMRQGLIPKHSILVVESIDRLSRADVLTALELFTSILKSPSEIEIVTLLDGKRYTVKTVNDNPMDLMFSIMVMARANEEARTKGDRVAIAWREKQRNAATVPLTKRCPWWLKLADDRTKYEVIPSAVKIVREMFKRAADGCGLTDLVKWLNGESRELTGFRYSAIWQKSTVFRTLKDRMVVGEYQPRKNLPDGSREKTGEAVKGYYPAVISDELFNRVQAAMRRRDRTPGRHRGRLGDSIANLFTGLVFSAHDGSTMVMRPKRWKRKDGTVMTRRRMVSSGSTRGVKGSVHASFDYEAFEPVVLRWLHDVVPGPSSRNVVADQVQAVEGQLGEVAAKIAKTKARMMGSGDFDSLLDVLSKLDAEKAKLTRQLDEMKSTAHAGGGEPTRKEALRLVRDMENAKDKAELVEIRKRLRSNLRALISEIWMLVIRENNDRATAHVQIHFAAGGHRKLTIITARSYVPEISPLMWSKGTETEDDQTMGIDLREYHKVSKKRKA